MFPLNPPEDPADDHTDQAGVAHQADHADQSVGRSEATLPTMADLDRMSMALDDIDDMLDNLDRRG